MDYNWEYLKKFNYAEDVKCEDCIFHGDTCKHEVEPMGLCRFFTKQNGKKPCRFQNISILLDGLDCMQTIEAYIDTDNKKVFVSKQGSKFLEKYDKATSIEFMDAPDELCYTKDWEKYCRGSIFPKYNTPCEECKYRKNNKCLNPKYPSGKIQSDCYYWVSKDNIKQPYVNSNDDGEKGMIYIDTFQKKVYTILYDGKPANLFTSNYLLCDLVYKREATKKEWYDDYVIPQPKKYVIDWEQYDGASLEKLQTAWNKLSSKQKIKAIFEDNKKLRYSIIKQLGEIFTEDDFNLLVKHYNKLVKEAQKNRDEIFLPAGLYENDILWEEIEDKEEIIDIEKEWVNHTVTYKTKFGTYYQFSYEGNYNWSYSTELVQVEPKNETVTIYK